MELAGGQEYEDCGLPGPSVAWLASPLTVRAVGAQRAVVACRASANSTLVATASDLTLVNLDLTWDPLVGHQIMAAYRGAGASTLNVSNCVFRGGGLRVGLTGTTAARVLVADTVFEDMAGTALWVELSGRNTDALVALTDVAVTPHSPSPLAPLLPLVGVVTDGLSSTAGLQVLLERAHFALHTRAPALVAAFHGNSTGTVVQCTACQFTVDAAHTTAVAISRTATPFASDAGMTLAWVNSHFAASDGGPALANVTGISVVLDSWHVTQPVINVSGCTFANMSNTALSVYFQATMLGAVCVQPQVLVQGSSFQACGSGAVVRALLQTATAIVFELTASQFVANENAVGFWLFNNNSQADIRFDVAGCQFVDNVASAQAAGVYFASLSSLRDSALTVRDSQFVNNRLLGVGFGAAVAFGHTSSVVRTSLVVSNCHFSENVAMHGGGAVGVFPVTPANVSIAHTAKEQFAIGNTMTISDTVFVANSAPQGGGGAIMVDLASSPELPDLLSATLTNVTFSNNSASNQGGAFFASAASYTFTDCHWTGNALTASDRSGTAVFVGLDTETPSALTLDACSVVDTTVVPPADTQDPVRLHTLSAVWFNGRGLVRITNSVVNSSNNALAMNLLASNALATDTRNVTLACAQGQFFQLATGQLQETSIEVELPSFQVIELTTNYSNNLFQCLVCSAGSYLPGAGSNVEAMDCLPCPTTGANCPGGVGSPALAIEGFWACATAELATFHQCPSGFCAGNNTCGAGRAPAAHNPLCARCAPNYVPVGDSCELCTASEAAHNTVYVLLAALAYVLFLLFICYLTEESAKKKILMYFLQTLRLLLGPSSAWASWLAFFNLG